MKAPASIGKEQSRGRLRPREEGNGRMEGLEPPGQPGQRLGSSHRAEVDLGGFADEVIDEPRADYQPS